MYIKMCLVGKQLPICYNYIGTAVSKHGYRSEVVIGPGFVPETSCPLMYRFTVDGACRECCKRHVCRLDRRRLEE